MIVGAEAANLLAGLHLHCFPATERWDAPAIAQLLRMPGCFGWVEAVADQPSGFALSSVVLDEAELLTLCVLPGHRRSGAGTRILSRVASIAAERGAVRLLLEVASGNRAAGTLYRGAGFTQVGLRRRYYPNGDDAEVLAAPLPLAACAAVNAG